MLEWKVVLYEEKETSYIISENGDLVNTKTGTVYKRKISNSGYVLYNLSLGNKIQSSKYAHRLVAEYFISNPLNKKQVNHIDGDKTNNHFSNLEWVTQEENMKHCMENGLSSLTKSINRYDINGKFIDSFSSSMEASRFIGAKDSSTISACLLGNYKTAHGFQWRFQDDDRPVIKLDESEIFSRKAVVQLTLKGEYIATFNTISEAYKQLGKKDNGAISQVCKGNRKSFSGFKWRYLTNYKN